jgi:hypothetical protein
LASSPASMRLTVFDRRANARGRSDLSIRDLFDRHSGEITWRKQGSGQNKPGIERCSGKARPKKYSPESA